MGQIAPCFKEQYFCPNIWGRASQRDEWGMYGLAHCWTSAWTSAVCLFTSCCKYMFLRTILHHVFPLEKRPHIMFLQRSLPCLNKISRISCNSSWGIKFSFSLCKTSQTERQSKTASCSKSSHSSFIHPSRTTLVLWQTWDLEECEEL